MKSAEVKAFLSCSFDNNDREVNNYIKAICDALDIKCVNVSDGYSEVPPKKAKQLISESQILIAIATKRDKRGDKEFNMPPAVHDEISIAYALEKPILLLREEGVSFDGFLGNYGTHISFSKTNLLNHEMLRTLVASIHTIKVDLLASHDLVPDQDTSGFYVDSMSELKELKKDGNEFIWEYSISKRLIFTENFKGIIKSAAWAAVPPVGADEKIKWELRIDGGSKRFVENSTAERDTPQFVEISTSISPKPLSDDFLDYSANFKSKYLNAIKKNKDMKSYKVGGNTFHCFDGTIPIQRIKVLKVQIRFPREYGLKKEDIFTFVGSYSTGVDYLVDSEMKRALFFVEDFGGNIIVDIKVESPLLKHVYGIAWNVPEI